MYDAMRAVEERMETLAKEVPQIDPTLEGATRSALGRMQDDLKESGIRNQESGIRCQESTDGG
jgi:hypothetical protein